MSTTLDLNCDLGEDFGIYQLSQADPALLQQISSANIACSFHAGDPGVMRTTVQTATANNIAPGAHPGLPDREGFGRRHMAISAQQAYDMLLYQIAALEGFARAAGAQLHHVKPHGALYHLACNDRSIAEAVVQAVHDFDNNLIIYGMSGSVLIEVATARHLRVANEVFADRTYTSEAGSNQALLTPRHYSEARIESSQQALEQVVAMVTRQQVQTIEGRWLPIQADTLCVHGDNPRAQVFVRDIVETLGKHHINIAPPGGYQHA